MLHKGCLVVASRILPTASDTDDIYGVAPSAACAYQVWPSGMGVPTALRLHTPLLTLPVPVCSMYLPVPVPVSHQVRPFNRALSAALYHTKREPLPVYCICLFLYLCAGAAV